MIGEPRAPARGSPARARARAATSTISTLPGLAHVAFVRSHHARARIVDSAYTVDAPPACCACADRSGPDRPRAAAAGDRARGRRARRCCRTRSWPRTRSATPASRSRRWWRSPGRRPMDAAELVEVEYEPVEAVVDPRDAPETLMRWERSAGDVEAALDAAAHRVASPLPDPAAGGGADRAARRASPPTTTRGDLLTVWASAQDPHRPLSQLAHALDRPRGADPSGRSRCGRRVRQQGRDRGRGGDGGARRDGAGPAAQVGRGPSGELPRAPTRGAASRRRSSSRSMPAGGSWPCAPRFWPTWGRTCCRPPRSRRTPPRC